MSLSIEILNTIRNNADTEYQTRVPEATRDNISEIGRAFAEYDLVYNTFATALIHKIGKTIVQTALFENKLKRFKSGTILTGQDIEEIWVESFRQAEGTYNAQGGFEENGIHPMKRRDYQDVQVMYHRMNRQDMYTITLYKDDVIKAFRSEETLSNFMTAQFNSMYAGAELDEYVHMKELLAEGIANNDFYYYPVAELTASNLSDVQQQRRCKDFVKTLKKAINDVGYVSTDFNPAGVKTKTDKSNLVLFINKDIVPTLDVDLYASVFGPDYAKLNIEIVEVDNFGSDNNGTYALLVDPDWFKCYDVKFEMDSIKNPQGLYTNYFLHVWQILSYSKFKTAIRFGTQAITTTE